MTLSFKTQVNLFFRKLISYFLKGLLYVSPMGIILYTLYQAFNWVDGILQPYLPKFHEFKIPGLGLLIILTIITIFGYFGQTVVAKPFKLIVERLIQKAPLLNMVYTSLRDFMEAFVGKEKKFKQPVLVKISSETDIERMGFITQNDLTELGITDKIAVYLPFSYAFSGEVLIVPSTYVRTVDIPAGEWMKFIVSGGVTRV